MRPDSRSATPTYIKLLHVASILLAKSADDHLLDPEGTLNSKLSSSTIASANSEVRTVIVICHFPTRVNTHCLAPCHLMRLLRMKIIINLMEKFAKLSSAKLVSLLIRQTLIPPNFRRLR